MLRISRSALKPVALPVLILTLACGIYVLIVRSSTPVEVRGRSLTLLPCQPSTRDASNSTVLPTQSRRLTDPEVNLVDRHFTELPSRYAPDKPKSVTQKPAVSIPSISSAEIQPCKNDTICKRNLLPDIDLEYWWSCAEKFEQLSLKTPIPKCRFMNGTHRAAVALVSCPGSGNTWVRGLLEQATGICTGSVYCDVSIRAKGMIGESIRSGTVLVVKTHRETGYQWNTGNVSNPIKIRNWPWPMCSSAILIVRNLFDVLISDWNRAMSRRIMGKRNNHVGVIGQDFFGDNQAWNRYIVKRTTKWQGYFRSLLSPGNSNHILLVRYEDIKANTVREVKRMLEFIKFPYKESDLVERLATDFDDFHRTSHPAFDHYTAEQRKYVRAVVEETVQLLKDWNHPSVAQIEMYL